MRCNHSPDDVHHLPVETIFFNKQNKRPAKLSIKCNNKQVRA